MLVVNRLHLNIFYYVKWIESYFMGELQPTYLLRGAKTLWTRGIRKLET